MTTSPSLLSYWVARRSALWLSACTTTFLLAVGIANAGGPPAAPPYLVAGSNHIIVGVVWEEAAVRRALPAWVTPVEGMTGAINIYQAERGYGLTPYQSAYFWVDVEGYDSPPAG